MCVRLFSSLFLYIRFLLFAYFHCLFVLFCSGEKSANVCECLCLMLICFVHLICISSLLQNWFSARCQDFLCWNRIFRGKICWLVVIFNVFVCKSIPSRTRSTYTLFVFVCTSCHLQMRTQISWHVGRYKMEVTTHTHSQQK